jgi:hypothetical protein
VNVIIIVSNLSKRARNLSVLLSAHMYEFCQVSARLSGLTLCLVCHSNGGTVGITFQFNEFKSGVHFNNTPV